MTTRFDTLEVERDHGVVTVTLDRPEKKNALNIALLDELLWVLREVQGSPDDRALVFTGSGGDFCSGADLAELPGPSSHETHPLEWMRRANEVPFALHQLTKPTIAKVRGVCVGSGFNLALGCDLIAAEAGARFSQIFSRRGLSVDFGGSWLLPRLIGLHRAKELVLLGELVPAAKLNDMGLLNRVVPDSELDEVVDQWARHLADGPPIAYAQSKQLLSHGLSWTLQEALDEEARAQALNFTTSDASEAVAAFEQKREPMFTGR